MPNNDDTTIIPMSKVSIDSSGRVVIDDPKIVARFREVLDKRTTRSDNSDNFEFRDNSGCVNVLAYCG